MKITRCGHAPARRDLQGERKSRDSAAEDEKIELFHLAGNLTQSRKGARN
ncbi:MAG: hypothetical protein ABSA45_11815 [Verrucomicrobiota bacterium]|jgi:hypothetical protein